MSCSGIEYHELIVDLEEKLEYKISVWGKIKLGLKFTSDLKCAIE